MSRPMQKNTRRFLIFLVIVALLGACFGSVALYAKKELSKQKFPVPDPVRPSLSELPQTKEETVSYVLGLYDAAVSAEDVETSWHTDAKLKDYDTDMATPFSAADNDIILYIREHAGDAIKALYPDEEHITQSRAHGVYLPEITAEDVLDYTAERGRYNDDGDYVDDDYYFITLSVAPETLHAYALKQSDVYANFKAAFADALTVENLNAKGGSVTMRFKIARVFDEIISLEITRAYTIQASVALAGPFAALTADGKAEVTLPYEATEKISFTHYGAHFTVACVAHTVGDMNSLPADVKIPKDTAQEDFTLSFTPSVEGVVEIDADGVMTVLKATEDPITVTMTLVYGGRTYTDTLTVYLTELEVATDAQ